MIKLNRVISPYFTFFKRLWLKKFRLNKELDSPTPGPSTNDRAMLHCPQKSENRIISAVTKNHRIIVPYQNVLSDQKKTKKRK